MGKTTAIEAMGLCEPRKRARLAAPCPQTQQRTISPIHRLPIRVALSYPEAWEFDEQSPGIAGIGHAPLPQKREQGALKGRCKRFRRAGGLATSRAGSNRVGRVP